jgi:hypothetical protein
LYVVWIQVTIASRSFAGLPPLVSSTFFCRASARLDAWRATRRW